VVEQDVEGRFSNHVGILWQISRLGLAGHVIWCNRQ
jgi:hypothetical protein